MFSSLTIKKAFEHKTLCECLHRRLDHRLLGNYIDEYQEEEESSKVYPSILCHCGCVTFKQVSNLRYLELLHERKV